MKAHEIKQFVVDTIQNQLENADIEATHLTDDFDLMNSGLIDSMSFFNLVVAIEDWLGMELNLEDLDPSELTKVGSLCKFVETQLEQT